MSNYKVHFLSGFLLSVSICYTIMDKLSSCVFGYEFNIITYIIICVMCCLGSLLPDIDNPNSKLGSKIRPISTEINLVFGHRTITHSIIINTFFIAIIFTWCLKNFNGDYNILVSIISLYMGIICHILFDMATPSGVPIFYPITNKRYKLQKYPIIIVAIFLIIYVLAYI